MCAPSSWRETTRSYTCELQVRACHPASSALTDMVNRSSSLCFCQLHAAITCRTMCGTHLILVLLHTDPVLNKEVAHCVMFMWVLIMYSLFVTIALLSAIIYTTLFLSIIAYPAVLEHAIRISRKRVNKLNWHIFEVKQVMVLGLCTYKSY